MVCVWVVYIVVCLCVRFTIASGSNLDCPCGCIALLAFVGELLLSWLSSLDYVGRVGRSLRWSWGVGLSRMFQLVWSRGPDEWVW